MIEHTKLSTPFRAVTLRFLPPHRKGAWLFGGVAAVALMAAAAPIQALAADAKPVAVASTAPVASSDASMATAVGLLLEKAQFWYEKGRPDVALDFYSRVLSLQQDNGDALIGAAKVSLDLSHDVQAHDFVERLRKISPDDPFVKSFDTIHRRSPEDAAALSEARHLAVLGRKQEAVAKYHTLFKNNEVPLDLAAEYYPLYITSVPEESVEADDALTTVKGLADKNPKDLALQLAAGQAMISLEGSRAEGIEKLHQLSHVAAVANRARTIWRQALLWQGADFQSLDQLNEYLAENPTDPELDAKMAEYKASLPSPGLRARMNGYEAVRTKNTKDGEKYFQAAIDYDAKDADAWVMMAVVRQLQGRPEWKSVLEHAISLAPERKTEFLNMLGADPVANAKAAAESQAKITAQYKEVDRLASLGKFAEAEAQLRVLMGPNKNAGSLLGLSDLQFRAGHADKAEATLRSAVAMEPDNADANLALSGMLSREGKLAEAKQLLDRAEAKYSTTNNEKGLQSVHSAKADLARLDALTIADLPKREAALRGALALDPTSWWIKLEIARTVYAEGRKAEAQTMMDEPYRAATTPGALNTQSGQDALQVAFSWAGERNDQEKASALAKIVPVDKQSDAMKRLLAAAAFRQSVKDIEASDPALAPQRLLALAAAPDPTGQRGLDIGQAFLRLQDADGMHQAVMTALDKTPQPTPPQRLSYAGVLMQGGRNDDAVAMIAPLDGVPLSSDQRMSLDAIKDSLASIQADSLLQAHRVADADAVLRARLAVNPDSNTLMVGQARVQIAQGHPDIALPTLLAALGKEPGNLAARMGAIEAALTLQYYSQASDLARDGMKLYPRNPYLAMQGANAARARGLNKEALDLMVKARALLNPVNESNNADTTN